MRLIANACNILCWNYFFLSLNKYRYFIKVYFMKLLDVNEYTCKIGKQDNVAKAPSSGNCWYMDLDVLSLVYVPTAEMFILISFALSPKFQ